MHRNYANHKLGSFSAMNIFSRLPFYGILNISENFHPCILKYYIPTMYHTENG